MSTYCSIKLSDDIQLDFTSGHPVNSKFDEVIVFWREKINKVCIFEDVIQEAIITLYNSLLKCIANQMTLTSNQLEVGRVGEVWNFWTNDLTDEAEENENDIFHQYWIWSTRDFQTWVYQKNGKSYMEISPSYRWHYVEPTENEAVIPFDEFMKQYTSLVVEIPMEQIKKNLESLEKIKRDLEIS